METIEITGYTVNVNSETGEEFRTLLLSSKRATVKISKITGKPYGVVAQCRLTCYLTEQQCKAVIGQTLEGDIVKVPSEPYTITTSNGDELTLDYRWQFKPADSDESLDAEMVEEDLKPDVPSGKKKVRTGRNLRK